MQILAKILTCMTSGFNRYFKARLFSGQISNVLQYHSGGDDYCPESDCDAIVGEICNNPTHKFIYCWKDSTPRKAQTGEKRLYSVKNGVVCTEIWLKNDGKIEINAKNAEINISETATVKCNSATIQATQSITADAPFVNLGGEGGGLVLTENSVILDSTKKPCIITPNTAKTKAL